jgi:hypothetical protein
LEQQLEEDNVVNALEEAAGKGQTLEETTVGSKASIVPSPHAAGNSCRVEGTSMAMETSYSHDGYECVLCKSTRDPDNSPAGWIALVQQYSLPSLVLSRGKVVDNFEDVNAFINHPSQRGLEGLEDQESKQLTTVMYDTEKPVYVVGSIDQQAPEHVQCCGHQVLKSMHVGMVDVLFVQDPKHTSGCWSIPALPVQEPKSLLTHKLLAIYEYCIMNFDNCVWWDITMWCARLQMHLSCLQDYHNSLVKRHSSGNGYPGLTVSL